MTGCRLSVCVACWCRTTCYVHARYAVSPLRPLTHTCNCCRVWWWRAAPFLCGGTEYGGTDVRVGGRACAAANQATIVAAGGVEAIVQGMQAHVGVATVQESGAAALWNLAANGPLLHHL